MENCLTKISSYKDKIYKKQKITNDYNTKYNNNSNTNIIKNEVTKYIGEINSIKIKINDENINHFIINSSELPKGLVLTSLD